MKKDETAVTHLILVINPGSTSTKFALFENEKTIFEETVRHPPGTFATCPLVMQQKEVRKGIILDSLKKISFDMSTLSAVVGRGGVVTPIDSGTYGINEKMLKDLTSGAASTHASALGGVIAAEIGKAYNIPSYVVDPVVVDEMEPRAKLTGIPGIERRSVFHALNTKAVARICAEQLGMRYEDCRFVIAHMGGGITISAHRYGRVIDVNDGLAGEGPFSPERCGAVPVEPIVEMCFSGQYSQEDILALCHNRGGLTAYLDTNDMRQVEKMIRQGDDYAALIMDTMAYQVAKEIGAMVAVLEGRVNAIIFTGGLAYSMRFTGAIKQYVDQIAKVMTFPGEHEMDALAQGALRVLTGKEKMVIY
jgi:butyrate kinase